MTRLRATHALAVILAASAILWGVVLLVWGP